MVNNSSKVPASTTSTVRFARPRLRLGVIPSTVIEAAFGYVVIGVAASLFLASVVGTHYGITGRDVPLTAIWRVAIDMAANPLMALFAFCLQVFLGLLQWGGRLMAIRAQAEGDRSYAIAYAAVYAFGLGVSVWLNWTAYADPMMALNWPPLLAFGLIVCGDIFPEFITIREEA